MAGILLEKLNAVKFTGFLLTALLLQIACFLIGIFIAPVPHNIQKILGTRCVIDFVPPPEEIDPIWHIPRGSGNGPVNCKVSGDNEDNLTGDEVAFAFQIPFPRDGLDLAFSRWNQALNGFLSLDITLRPSVHLAEEDFIPVEAKLGYRSVRDSADNWTLLASSRKEREICSMRSFEDAHRFYYNCDLMPLFELASVHHDYYLLNVRFPVENATRDILQALHGAFLVIQYENEHFIQAWLTVKGVFTVIVFLLLLWYWRELHHVGQSRVLMEKMLLVLGIALTILNIPVELLTLWIDIPFMTLLNDVRTCLLYAVLLCFWPVFCGEHLVDNLEKSRIWHYWKSVIIAILGCIILFSFNIYERVIQLEDPFFTYWTTKGRRILVFTSILVSAVLSCFYFIFLAFVVYKIFTRISSRASIVSPTPPTRRLCNDGVVYRIKCLLVITLLCVALTITAYMVDQLNRNQWKWVGNVQLSSISSILTGVYGSWNLYMAILLVLYTPSSGYAQLQLNE